ncbi:Retrovirus-related Pol polyprotein from type-2 retrotransposable element R2DM [Cucumis melo var. makuwa]|uniref:Retrovirus-related Pol polyprotein from type-2 retrotransposable element R2DM n=1 Tax=Cucumis melo var. makuwa TaxID=1194695 RepID=A0A5D3E6S5_CUCMM|nr:Retrovirus-related Pol polyprotein from type-2 retrotransposable element R2DM [Cucumis melo var. makuwa]
MSPPKRTTLLMRPQVRQDYPLSLSISISGGKETYKDSSSNDKRIGKSPTSESGVVNVRIVFCRSILNERPGLSPWKGAPKTVRAPLRSDLVIPRRAVNESGCLGMSLNRMVNSVQS